MLLELPIVLAVSAAVTIAVNILIAIIPTICQKRSITLAIPFDSGVSSN